MPIKNYSESDYRQVLKVYAACKLDELKQEPQTFFLCPLQNDPVRHHYIFTSKIYTWQENGAIVAFGALKNNEIRSLYVLQDYRGLGIGRRLLEHMLKRCKEPAELFVSQSNNKAKQLYQEYGFDVVESFETEYNGLKVTAQRMQTRAVK